MIFFAFVCRSYLRFILAFCAGAILGIFLVGNVIADQKIAVSYVGKPAVITANVSENPEFKNGFTRVKVNNLSFNYSTNTLKCQGYIMLAEEHKNIFQSDEIIVNGTIATGFGEYIISIFRPQVLAINKPDPPDLAQFLRRSLVERVRSTLNESGTADLALGFLIGEKSLPDTLKQQLKIVGLSHIVVASGYCLSILVNFAKKVTGKISRTVSYVVSLVLILLFISMTGLSPSLLRAGLVSGFSLCASYVGRRFHPFRLLCYAAAVSIIVSPLIIANVAWQLSFASYAGLIILSPLLKTYFYGQSTPGVFADMIFATISAQLFCLPVSVYAFGQLSIISIISNIVVTPIIPAVMALTFVCGVVPLPVVILAMLNQFLLKIQLLAITNLSQLKWAAINLPTNDLRVFVLYLPLIILIIVLKYRTNYSFRPVLALDKSPKYGKIYTC